MNGLLEHGDEDSNDSDDSDDSDSDSDLCSAQLFSYENTGTSNEHANSNDADTTRKVWSVLPDHLAIILERKYNLHEWQIDCMVKLQAAYSARHSFLVGYRLTH